VELASGSTATHHTANTRYLLRTVPGLGAILSVVRL
jgi:transposase